jgi:hypothetical protein
MKLHHVITYIFVNSLALGFIACSSNSGTHMPPMPTVPVTTEAPATTVAPSTTLPASCPQAGPGMYKCYDWGPCKGLYADRDSAIAALRQFDSGGCHKLDDEVLPDSGFGPCSQCIAFKPAGVKAMSAPLSFQQLLEARAKLLMQKSSK